MEKFTKVKNIGKGNMGACALARNNDDGRYYVIKQVDLAKLNKKERQQSLNEAKLLSQLRHPNIINYVDSFLARKSDHLCIVMEFADGGDLGQKIKQSHGVNFPQDQVLDWFIQCALALQNIHSKKILHRDVKTANIFLTQEGVCKLGDFGIARTLSSTFDQANTFVGTPYYLSPELILERPYDAMSDVWALGVVLYEMMALKHPFNANDMKSLMHRILKVQYEAPPHIYSSEMRSIVARLLVKDPAQRMRLSEVFELPIVVQRMQQWLAGGIVPSRYIASLIRHKLFPPSVQVPQGPQDGQLPQLVNAANHAPRSSSTEPPMGGRSSTELRRLQIQQQQQAIQERMGPKPTMAQLGGGGGVRYAGPIGSAGVPMMQGAAMGGNAPMPSRDPSLLNAAGVGLGGGGGGLPMLAAAQPKSYRLPSMGAGGLDPQQQQQYLVPQSSASSAQYYGVPAEARQYVVPGAGGGYASNMPTRLQPSVRQLSALPPPNVPAKPPGPPNSDIQALLQKAAQERAMARQRRV